MLPDYNFSDLEPFIQQWWSNGLIKGVLLSLIAVSVVVLMTKGFISIFWKRE